MKNFPALFATPSLIPAYIVEKRVALVKRRMLASAGFPKPPFEPLKKVHLLLNINAVTQFRN